MPPLLDNPRLLLTAIVAALLNLPAMTAQTNDDFSRGVAEFQAGNYQSAAANFAKAEATSPGTTDALLYQSKSLIHLNDFPAAENALRHYIAAHQQSSDASYLLGFILHRENRPAESLAAYTQAATLSTPSAEDLKIVALDYVLLNDYPDAIKWLQKAVEFDPNNEDAWYYLGRAYYTKGSLPEARKTFQHLLELDPRDVRAENNLGLILETEGQPAAAIDAYRRSIAWQQQSLRPSEQPYVNLGSLLLEQGQTKDALPPLQKATELAPSNAYCHLKLGMVYRKLGRFSEAQQELEKTTQLEPENAAAHYQLGRTLKENNSLQRAQAEFDRAAELQTRAAGSQTQPPAH
jgi:tetratricopeptide (TPR) repeat protein